MISKELRPYFQGRLRITAFSWFSGFLRAKDSLQEAFNLVGQFRHKAGPDETVNVVKDKLGPWLLSVPDYDLAGALWNTNIPMAPPVPPDALAQRHRERRGKNTRSLFLALCVLCASARRNHTPYTIH